MSTAANEKFIPGNHSNVRNINRCVILNVIRQYQPISRIEIAGRIQLTKSTVTNIVNELLQEGLVQEISVGESTGGRKPTLLKLATTGVIIGAISINRDATVLGLCDMEGNILQKEIVPTQKENPEQFLQECGEQLQSLLKAFQHEKVLGIGVGVPGLVKREQGIILHFPQLGWNYVAVKLILEKIFALPVYVENDANLEALARLFYSKRDEEKKDFVHLTVGEGLGVGIVLNQQILRGTNTSSIEFGHNTINEGGEACTCGNHGCWEAYASDWATIRRYHHRLQAQRALASTRKPAAAHIRRLTVSAVENGIMLDWMEADHQTIKYSIYRGKKPAFQILPKNQLALVAHPPFIDVAIEENAQYFYKIQPRDAFDQEGELSAVVGCKAPALTYAFGESDAFNNLDEYQIDGDGHVAWENRKLVFGVSRRDEDNVVARKAQYDDYLVIGKVKPIAVGPYDSVGVIIKRQSRDHWYYALLAYGHQLKEKYNLAFMRRRMRGNERDEMWLAFYPMHIDPKEEYTIKVGVFGDWMRMKTWKSCDHEPANWQFSVKDDLGWKKGRVGFRHYGRKAEAHGLKLIPLPTSVEHIASPETATLSEVDRHLSNILVAAQKGDKAAIDALQETGRYLGLGISNLFNGLGINTYFVKGKIVQAWDGVAPALMAEFERRTFAENLDEIKIIPVEASEGHELMGCVALVTSTLFEGYRIEKWHGA